MTEEEPFPNLDRTKVSPALFRLNGCGLGFYFRDNVDRRTRTYVMSQCVTLLWIPLFPIARYRLADADNGGWIVLGRERLNTQQRVMRAALALGIAGAAGLITWSVYTSSEGYKVGRQMDAARQSADNGELDEAARAFRVIVRTAPKYRAEARASLSALLPRVSATTTSPTAAAVVFGWAQDPGDDAGPVAADLWAQARRYAEACPVLKTSQKIEWLEGLHDVAPDDEARQAARLQLIESGATRPVPDLWAVSEFAAHLFDTGDRDRAEALLAPHANALATLEGARVLGQIRSAQGKADEACRLLDPYVTKHLTAFHAARTAYIAAYAAAQARAISGLDDGDQSKEWYAAYERADKSEKQRLVDEAISAAVLKDREFEGERRKFVKASSVVPVAMDLGIARMIRGRTTTDPDEARRELQAAERVFSEIHEVAADDPEYRFAAARVAYWLGKHDESTAHIEAAIAAAGDSHEVRFEAGSVLHSLGESAAARGHWEAAYDSAKTDDERRAAASAVAAVTPDEAAALVWLRRGDVANPAVAADIARRTAQVALSKGDLAAAERELTSALAIYDRLPRSSTTLNNAALVASLLSSVTGRVESLSDAATRLRASLAEAPTNVVVIMNTASTLYALGWAKVLGDDVDLRDGVSTLRGLRSDNEAGDRELGRKAAATDEIREAVRIVDRGLALAGGNVDLISLRSALAEDVGDAAAERALLTHVRAAKIDTDTLRELERASLAEPVDTAPLRAVQATISARLSALPPDAPVSARAPSEISYIQCGTAIAALGDTVDLVTLDDRARKLRAAFTCGGTRAVERATAILLLHERLMKSDDRYRRESARTQRGIGAERLVLQAILSDANLRATVVKWPEFVRVLDIASSAAERNPTACGGQTRTWCGIGGRDTGSSATPGTVPDWALDTEMFLIVSPFSASRALDAAFARRLTGDTAGAEAALRECARLGGVLPYRE